MEAKYESQTVVHETITINWTEAERFKLIEGLVLTYQYLEEHGGTGTISGTMVPALAQAIKLLNFDHMPEK